MKKMIQMKYFAFIAVMVFFISCSKEDKKLNTDQAIVSIKLAGVENNISKLGKNNGASQVSETEAVQQFEIAFDSKIKIVARLEPVNGTAVNNTIPIKKKGQTPKAAATINDLPVGTMYRVIAYNNAGAFVESKDYTVGTTLSTDDTFKLTPGQNYTFVAYSVGTAVKADLDNVMPSGDFSTAKYNNVDGNKHFMYYVEPAKSYAEGMTTLNIVLKHQFSQISTVLNLGSQITGTFGNISASIKPHLSNVNINVNGPVVDFTNGTPATNGALMNFTLGANGRSATAETIICAADQTATGGGTLTFSTLTINGQTKSNLVISGLKIVPGGRYILTFNIATFTPDNIINVGDLNWAPGNLVYSLDGQGNPVYSFALTNDAFGNYWFPEYSKPKVLGGSDQGPSDGINGPKLDPCSLVLPLNTWRLPAQSEMDILKTRTDAGGADNPENMNNYDPARFVDTYDGTVGTHLGMFFGNQGTPGTNRDKYLYLPYGGAYHNEDTRNNTLGTEGYYLVSSPGGIKQLFMTGVKNDVGYGMSTGNVAGTTACQIRCVKN